MSVGTGPDDNTHSPGGAYSHTPLRASVPSDVNRVLMRGSTNRSATVDEVVATRGAGESGFKAGRGSFPLGLQQRIIAPGDGNLLGIDTSHLHHALAGPDTPDTHPLFGST